MSIVIAVDGTAASGKGTLAKRLARHFNFAHMDSGALYRLTALAVLEAHGDPGNEADALKGARTIDLSRSDDPVIRSAEIGRLSSVVAVFPSVRDAILGIQRQFAALPPGAKAGAVIDGRDIGTVVCPDATLKLFVDADPVIRGHRRWLELRGLGSEADEESLVDELVQRDKRDRERAVSPLKPAEDAYIIDTTNLDVESMVARGLYLAREKLGKISN